MRSGLFLVAIAGLASLEAHADGMRVEHGRYSGGSVTTLAISKDQLQPWPKERWIGLTADQKAKLKRDTGVAPSKVFLYDARIGETDCTCHAWNVAFLFASDKMDVPHEFVVDDEEAARRQADFDAID